jgi:hypothetical protein
MEEATKFVSKLVMKLGDILSQPACDMSVAAVVEVT